MYATYPTYLIYLYFIILIFGEHTIHEAPHYAVYEYKQYKAKFLMHFVADTSFLHCPWEQILIDNDSELY